MAEITPNSPADHKPSGNGHSKSRFSLRLRVTAWVVIAVAIVQVVTAVVVLLYQQQGLRQQVDEELTRRLNTIITDLTQDDIDWSADRLARIASGGQQTHYFDRFNIAVYNSQGELAGSTLDDFEDTFGNKLKDLISTASEVIQIVTGSSIEPDQAASNLRLATRRFKNKSGDNFVLCVVTSDSYVYAATRTSAKALLYSAPLGLVAVGFAAWFVAGLALVPIQELGKYVRELNPQTVDTPLEVSGGQGYELDELHAELEAARQRLEHGYDAQGRFIANVSHEMKTPLSVIIAESQVMLANKSVSEEARAFARSIHDELIRLANLIESFLLLTRVKEGHARIHDRLYPLNELVMDSITSCVWMADQHDIKLITALADGEDEALFVGDPELLRTAIDNLIRNAIRFTPKGEAVHVQASRDDEHIYVSVRDSGPGIPSELIPTLFTRFSQSPDERRRGRGSGLGLEIAQGIAELHKGRVSVQNLPVGCEFIITLPRAHRPAHNSNANQPD